MPKEKLVNIEFVCPECGMYHYLYNFPESLYERVVNRRYTGEYIQDILKDYSPEDRERFITSLCPDCQKEQFGIPEDDD